MQTAEEPLRSPQVEQVAWRKERSINQNFSCGEGAHLKKNYTELKVTRSMRHPYFNPTFQNLEGGKKNRT